jgi:hypothetical protein
MILVQSDKYNKLKALWSTRYNYSSEINEVKHKSLRNYFESTLTLPKINKY